VPSIVDSFVSKFNINPVKTNTQPLTQSGNFNGAADNYAGSFIKNQTNQVNAGVSPQSNISQSSYQSELRPEQFNYSSAFIKSFFDKDTLKTTQEQFRKVPVVGLFPRALDAMAPRSDEEARQYGMIKMGNTYVDPLFTSSLEKVGSKVVKQVAPKIFTGFKDLTTKVLERLKGKTTVSKQFI